VLEVYYLEERPMLDEGPFRNEERRLIDTLAQLLSEAVEKKENEIALVESERRFRSLVEQAADAIFVHNLEGKLVDVNQHACESLGYTRDEMLSSHVPYFEMRFDLKKLMELWEDVIANGPITAEGIHRRKDGTTFPVEVRFSLIRAEKNQNVLVMARDITERKNSEMELKKDRDQLEDLVQKRVAELKAMHEHLVRT
ncbi:MAG: PAS domain-containing protein, partial [Nitrospinales bacterium]